ncbi:hypothetical protein FYJ78_12325 [Selenomonas sp. WCA-380-WT-3B 3/]|uniref:Phosphate-selective porin O and P n=1 Tax=Selenomonas montiformis TaxID=2652285 RepID=A0A6I2V0N8_9FIRM|nr:hypothetical protein [Selenomonas montiformis]MSV25934.1 hypothetical protein [Selenomonas montiformis]
MKKKLLTLGLVPALVLGTGAAAGAQPAAPATAAAPAGTEDDSAEPVTQESLQALRSQLEEQLYEAQELQKRLNAQLDSLNKRVSKVEKKTDQPRVDIHGYGRFRWDKQHFEDFKGIDMKSVWLNLFINHRINDRWSLHSEHEFENNLSNNHGAYEGDGGYDKDGGKKYSRPVLQLYAEGRVGEVDVKLGRFYLQSPYKFTFDEKVDGWQASYGVPTHWGRKAMFTLNSGNTYSKILYGDRDNKLDVWAEGGSTNFRVLSLISEIPVAKNTNLTSHYGKMTRRDDHMTRETLSVGFDTKLNRDLKLSAAFAKSDSDTLNKSHFLQLQYKEAKPDVPGSFDVYVKKYLQRGHTGMTNWFNDDIQDPTTSDYFDDLQNHAGVNLWDVYRSGEFNGLRIGVDFVPVRNTKLLLYYTYGKLGLFDPPTGALTGVRKNCSFFRTQWEVYF